MNCLTRGFYPGSRISYILSVKKSSQIKNFFVFVLCFCLKELLAYFFRRHFLLSEGLRVLLDECNTGLTYLNVYTKNHLKQLANIDEKQAATNATPEEYLQARANCSDLKNDLNFLLKFLSLSASLCTSSTNEADELKSYSNEDYISQLTNLVLASQIAAITTCAADLSFKKTSEDKQNSELTASHLTRLSIKLIDTYLGLMGQVETKLYRTNLVRNLSAKCVYVEAFHLKTLVDICMASTPANTASDLELFAGQLVKMLKCVFLDAQMTESAQKRPSSLAELDLKIQYSNTDLFCLLNSGHNLFKLLFDLFRAAYGKACVIYSTKCANPTTGLGNT